MCAGCLFVSCCGQHGPISVWNLGSTEMILFLPHPQYMYFYSVWESAQSDHLLILSTIIRRVPSIIGYWLGKFLGSRVYFCVQAKPQLTWKL